MSEQDEIDLEHRTIKALEQLNEQEESIGWQRRELLALLLLNKPWKRHGLTRKQYIVDRLQEKPSSVDLEVRILERFADIVRTVPGISKSRLSKALAIEFPTPENERTFIVEYCTKAVPHDAFAAKLREITNTPEPITCDHMAGREYWCKCKKCNTWIEDKH